MDYTDTYKEQLLPIIFKYLPKCKIYLFGSRAAQSARSGSDIDLGLDAGEPIEWKKIVNIQNDIDESTIPVYVDLIDMHSAPESFKTEILKKGIIWNP